MSKPINVSDTLTFVPSSLDTINSDYPGTYYKTYVLENAFDGADSSSRWAPYTNTGRSATTTIYLNFDCSSIPNGATINSVACSVKCGTQGTYYYNTRTVQMSTGTTVKGSATTMSGSNTSPSTHNLTVGSWTAAELQNAKLKFYLVRTTDSSYYNTGATFSIYGATLSVSYTYSGIVYEVTAASSVTGVTATPASQDITPGDSAEIRIDADSLDNLSITDNDIDISSSLVQHTVPSGGTEDTVLGTYSLVSGGFNGSGASYFQGIVGNGANASTTTSNYYSSDSGTIAIFTYDLNFSNIPSNATITELYVQVNGHAESTSNSNEYMCAALYLGTSTAISDELNFKSVGTTSNSTQTITATTLPTVAQLSNLKLRCRLGYYGGAINGATCYLAYTVPGGNSYYWTYTIPSVTADHVILIEEAGVFIPPEEDPTETYWPITISSINASTNPANGTIRVVEGSNQTITISPTDPQLTLALDNGVDITSQLQGGAGSNTYTVTQQVSGADYGFTLNGSTGYYESTNQGVGSSASVCRINFSLDNDCLITFDYIIYTADTEANYDYCQFGAIDTALSTDNTRDSGVYHDGYGESSINVQTLTYELTAGSHFIDIKYRKDSSYDEGNDSLQ